MYPIHMLATIADQLKDFPNLVLLEIRPAEPGANPDFWYIFCKDMNKGEYVSWLYDEPRKARTSGHYYPLDRFADAYHNFMHR